mmetsp:Transcript_15979/g.20278  ORF Transcript_15979/g.20278 Transcript_15979/m.20278 type:complete len:110 (+) Transcript_15979:241-570(+)|eukprot:CAMPEP_0203643820 /NCGR_PEP_ID=MMETSP0088-20131115/9257_1 /ASSEMBLY_ACC=CAM_ASM_001087 /TAXON_ID=426623 /ORGANISM="Chaetoceros affinis, Strain CCMP159" /LENGTH=109 /DNA_ID=CAMNT_0050500127 /DNA_START=99 /DNA_END=431 /DNA_ORIENTATION=+
MPRPTKADPDKQLMIKSKTVQRLAKEVKYYEQEVKENEEKLAKMKEEQKDPYDIKKFAEVLGESQMMIPDSQNRYKKSLEDLKSFLETHVDYDFTSEEWVTTAKELLSS